MTTIRNTIDTAAFPAVVIAAFFVRNAGVIAGLAAVALLALFTV